MGGAAMSEGSCYCGALTFKTPDTSLWCAHCHCTMCQRAHGAGFVTWVGYPEDKVEVNGPTLRWFQSSDRGERGFCQTCGSTVFFKGRKWPGELHIARANLGDIDRQPAGHAHIESRVPWIEKSD